MDPLSITAGIIAVVGASGTVGKGLRKLVALRNAPDCLFQLNNEVTDLQLIVQAVVINAHDSSADDSAAAAQHQLIRNALSRVKKVVLELEELIEYALTKVTDSGSKIDKVAWLRAEKKIQNVKDKIRDAKGDLTIASHFVNSATSKRVELQLSELRITSEGTSSRCVALEDLVNSMSGAMLRQGQPMEEVLQTIIHRPIKSNVIQSPSLYESNIAIDELTITEEKTPSVSDELQPSTSPSREYHQDDQWNPGTLYMELTGVKKCGPPCPCPCHHQKRVRSPRLLDDILGSLFIGYSGLPCYQQTCDRDCKQGSSEVGVGLQYAFPRWMLNRIVCMRVMSSKIKGPELLLRCLRVRPRNAPIFQATLEGNLSGVMDLLTNGQASLLDVSPQGNSLLHFSSMSPGPLRRRVLVETLLKLGADPFLGDEHMISPYQLFWSRAFRQHVDSWVWTATNFYQEDPIEYFGFSKLHLALLRLKHTKCFDTELLATPRISIDQRDSQGRTPLAWAAYHGEVEAVKKLLQRGADPNIADLRGDTPFHLAACAGGCQATQCLASLLQVGADIDACNVWGGTALILSIRYRGRNSLKFLLDSGAKYCTMDTNGRSLLNYAVFYGSISILSIMQRAGLHSLNIDLVDEYGRTAMQIAQWRRDFNAEWSIWYSLPEDKDPLEWFRAFKDLLDSIRAADIAKHYTDFAALINSDVEWDSGEDTKQQTQENWMSLPGSFPAEEDKE